jgi:drug/metabolite transporter (DMT)-like permease
LIDLTLITMQPDDPRPFRERLATFRETPGARALWLYALALGVVLTGVAIACFVSAARQDRADLVGLGIIFVPPAILLLIISWRARSTWHHDR